MDVVSALADPRVLCAYPLCLSLQLSNAASMSGLIIGVFMEASAVGMGVSWKILNVYPELWRRHIKTYLVAGLSCQFLGAMALCKVALAVRNGNTQSTLIFTLLAARIIQGFGHGLNDQFMKCCIVKLAPAYDRPRHALKKFVANTLGIGCGPIIIAMAYFFFRNEVTDAGLARGAQISVLTGQWQLTMTTTVLVGSILLYPSLEDCPLCSAFFAFVLQLYKSSTLNRAPASLCTDVRKWRTVARQTPLLEDTRLPCCWLVPPLHQVTIRCQHTSFQLWEDGW